MMLPYLLAVLVLLLGMAVIRKADRRTIYAAFAAATIVSMVAGSPLQAFATVRDVENLDSQPSLSQALSDLGLSADTSGADDVYQFDAGYGQCR